MVKVNKSGKVTIKAMLIAVLLFGGLITGLGNFASEVGGNYNQTQTDFPSFDKSNSINNTVAQFVAAIQNPSIFNLGLAFLLMPAAMITILLDAWSFTVAMISEVFSSTIGLPVPEWFVSLIMVGGFAVMIFALWNAITGRRDT